MGYKKYNIQGIVAVSPLNLTSDLEDIVYKQLCQDYEGKMDNDIGLIVLVDKIIDYDKGEIVPEDSNIFFRVKFSVITYIPKLHEIVFGKVTQATDFGAFINIGPFEGLCHVSQVMPDFNSFNPELPGFVAKESKKSVVVEDEVLTRIANISFKKSIADTKIGLTMRQTGLGKADWEEPKPKKTTTKAKKSTKKKGDSK